MAGLVCTDSGDLALGNQAFGKTTPPTAYKWHFFTNNYTPVKGTTLSDLTELSGTLYTPPTVNTSAMTLATAAHVTTMTAADLTVAISGACTIYGYFVTDSAGTTLYWAEQWLDAMSSPAPLTFGTGGGTITQPVYLQLN